MILVWANQIYWKTLHLLGKYEFGFDLEKNSPKWKENCWLKKKHIIIVDIIGKYFDWLKMNICK